MLQLQDILEVPLPLRALFERPTIAGLVDALSEECEGGRTQIEEIAHIWLSIEDLSEEQLDQELSTRRAP